MFIAAEYGGVASSYGGTPTGDEIKTLFESLSCWAGDTLGRAVVSERPL